MVRSQVVSQDALRFHLVLTCISDMHSTRSVTVSAVSNKNIITKDFKFRLHLSKGSSANGSTTCLGQQCFWETQARCLNGFARHCLYSQLTCTFWLLCWFLDLYVEWICDLGVCVCVCSWLWVAVPAVGGRWRMTSPPQMDALGCCTPVARGCRCAALTVKLSPSSRSQTRATASPPTSVWAQMPSSSLISPPPAPSPPPATVRPLTRSCASVFVMNRRAFL